MKTAEETTCDVSWKPGAASSSADEDDGSEEQEEQQPAEPDPLYDEGADDRDEKWVEKQRGGRQSDAVLRCAGKRGGGGLEARTRRRRRLLSGYH